MTKAQKAARNAYIRREYIRGVPPKVLSEQLQLSVRTIHALTQDVARDRHLPPAESKEVVKAYLAGYTIRAIAGAHNRREETIRRELLLAGLPLRPRSDYHRKLTDAEEQELARQYEQGKTMAELARTIPNGDKSFVSAALRRQGVQVRTMQQSRTLRGTWRTGPRKSKVEYP